jgi:hypothetical protein
MSKLYTALAASALLFVLAAPGPAGAAERRADGVRTLDQLEFSAQRRHYGYRRHHVRRYYGGPRYYGPRYRYGYYGNPYYGYGPRYYGGPGISLGFGFGPRYGYW